MRGIHLEVYCRFIESEFAPWGVNSSVWLIGADTACTTCTSAAPPAPEELTRPSEVAAVNDVFGLVGLSTAL